MNTADLTDFGIFIKEECDKRGITPTELAEKAGLDTGNFSRILKGKQPVTHRTAEKVADYLQLPISTVRLKAGLRVEALPSKRDPSVEYWAQQLDLMPKELREEALDVVGAVVDALNRVTGSRARRTKTDLTHAALEAYNKMMGLETIKEKEAFLRDLSASDKEVFNILHEWNRGKPESKDDVDWDQFGDGETA